MILKFVLWWGFGPNYKKIDKNNWDFSFLSILIKYTFVVVILLVVVVILLIKAILSFERESNKWK